LATSRTHFRNQEIDASHCWMDYPYLASKLCKTQLEFDLNSPLFY